MVEAESNENVIFSKEAPTQSQGNNGSLQIALSQADTRDNALLDNVIVSFDENRQLGKFYFGTQSANIYIPQGADKYAIVSVGRDGVNTISTMDVNFKATKTGGYTLSFEGEEMNLNGIYLIDMLAGQEINLSVNPSYTFIGSPADRTARFKIVFRNVGDNGDDIFAYQNGSDIIVRGEGELQIFDVMGRIVSTHRISGVETINVKSQGVYIFRLNEKTQKIVVK